MAKKKEKEKKCKEKKCKEKKKRQRKGKRRNKKNIRPGIDAAAFGSITIEGE